MLFASDLDQTLIYSQSSFRLAPGAIPPALNLVEIHEGREISYVANSVALRLQRLLDNVCFVPVTTRTIEQYRRISLFRRDFTPDYAIVCNGGHILVRGNPDEAWNRQVRANMEQFCADRSLILARFGELQHESWIQSSRTVDRLFDYFIVERATVPAAELNSFTEWAEQQNWRVSLQGRKLYFVPKVVNKWDAVAHVRNLTGRTRIAAAGDSLLDLCMLEQADFAIAPCHGEIWEHHSDGRLVMVNIRFTKQQGIYAADEILDFIFESAGK
ncbi:MAG TPA: HAD family hydrolase [Methylomusa anaerophila]|uniref:Sucrose phosphatase-like domain-containing protein n=1 Tax=Methylomusa anaerophila TaxID=1930071 RepID=A0A348AK68_9FIRM|nr:HAD family hydrolase [Methylomusa anaerophila]BBB91466.1 hypothetical protein MAMMFC1_02150 [Methylomusa anaerophila]HML89944.1 HAD family hydrolase [Methylomusa anaerophila]